MEEFFYSKLCRRFAYNAFITGSMIYGKDPKDIDIVIPTVEKAEVVKFILENNFIADPGQYFDSIIVSADHHLPLNIIFVPMGDIGPWKFATEKMKQLPVIEDKKRRTAMFELFKAIHKLTNIG